MKKLKKNSQKSSIFVWEPKESFTLATLTIDQQSEKFEFAPKKA
jgi:hypothetical protein